MWGRYDTVAMCVGNLQDCRLAEAELRRKMHRAIVAKESLLTEYEMLTRGTLDVAKCALMTRSTEQERYKVVGACWGLM